MPWSVLLVDDEYWALKSMEIMFPWEKYGFRIVGRCTDSKDALNIMLNVCPDVVMTDVRMPDVSGTDLLRRAREEGLSSVFVLVSAVSDFEAARLGMHYGAVEYCLKPLEMEACEALLQHIVKKMPEEAGAEPMPEGLIADVLNYIDANLHRKLTLPMAAEHFHMSSNSLGRQFRAGKGTTFGKYVDERRLEVACRLLENRRLSIAEIAEQLGFSNQNYFAVCFKRRYSVSPNKFRAGKTDGTQEKDGNGAY